MKDEEEEEEELGFVPSLSLFLSLYMGQVNEWCSYGTSQGGVLSQPDSGRRAKNSKDVVFVDAAEVVENISNERQHFNFSPSPLAGWKNESPS